MPCHTDGSPCTGFFSGNKKNSDHCSLRVPDDPNRSTVEVTIYPEIELPSSTLEKYPKNAVMYDSLLYSQYPPTYQGGRNYLSPGGQTENDHEGECGKELKPVACGTAIFDYYPGELSFQQMDSDTWFSFLFDTGLNGGVIGKPCYHIVRETETHPKPSGTIGSSKSTCYPCQDFSCTPQRAYCRYTYNGPDETGDPDCPYPLIFGIGTDSNKVVIKYDQLSSTVPDVVVSMNFVYSPDGIDVNAWNPATYSADPIVTSQNTWENGEESFSTFAVFEGSPVENNDSQGLKLKLGIGPALDNSDPVNIIGTQWEFLELISGGQNYSVGDTFSLTYAHTHPSGNVTNFTIDVKVEAIGPATLIGGADNFDLLLQGDELNGHAVIGTFHTDVENFPYHVIYIDKNGADFEKDTQYTSSRNHVVTAVAGYGIKDRAWFGGLYEFFDKSLQYTTHDVDTKHTNLFNDTEQPEITVTVSNGQVTGATIDDGGKGWNLIPDAKLVVTSPYIDSGRTATVEGSFSGGVLVGVTITDPGSGYESTNPPKMWVSSIYREDTFTSFEGIDEKQDGFNDFINDVQQTGIFPEFVESMRNDPSQKTRLESYQPKNIEVPQPDHRAFKDSGNKRTIDLPQRRYRSEEVDKLRATFPGYEMPLPPSVFPSSYIENSNEFFKTNTETTEQAFDNLVQDVVPDTISYDKDYVETTQRRFLDMPKASRTTKYFIKQYRADSSQKAIFTITLGSDLEEEGCEHVTCPAPVVPSTLTIPENVEGVDIENTYEYSLLTPSIISGPGCKSWQASGEMLVRHHLTKATNTYTRAVQSYGNPFDI